MRQPGSRRLARVRVPEQLVLGVFGGLRTDCVVLPALALPGGAELFRVHHDDLSRSFVFLVEHPSYDEVPEGEYPPTLPCEMVTLEVSLSTAKRLAEVARLDGLHWEDRGLSVELLRECKRLAELGVAKNGGDPAEMVKGQLRGDIDSGPARALAALADLFEEGGDRRLAAGYRWLLREGRWPECGDRHRRWQWFPALGEYAGFTSVPGEPRRLPKAVYDALPRDARVRGVTAAPFPSASAALDAAAVAAGDWLAADDKESSDANA